MQDKGVHRGQRGAAAVEYGVIVGLVSLVVTASVTLLGGNLSDTFCNTARSLGSDASCVQGSSAAAEGSGAGAGTGTGSGSGSAATTSGGSAAGVTGATEDSGSGAVGTGTSSGSTDQAATNSAGTLTFYTAVVDQDQRKRDLSARFNLGWFPDSWTSVEYPDSLTVDVTWTPALEVDQVITGESGRWDYTLVEPGHMRLTRSGSLETGGFNPEPEILLTKSGSTQNVSVTFTAEAPNTPPVSATSTTVSVPSK